ncbi:hypothetical protein MLD38_016330 [Melastoma candidum]|uniref:Uncharacterized protein n=1 Tax=Melastoma candidum TaxID=119954 RepID=A0ACB9RL10_9MYRT|nr:hypothetical protein MLD38_016330 [Melastoma candidum]
MPFSFKRKQVATSSMHGVISGCLFLFTSFSVFILWEQKDGRLASHSECEWSVVANVESLAWNPHSEHCFVASLDDATVRGFDIRVAAFSSGAKAGSSFTIHAHEKATSTVSYNPLVPNILATGSYDKTVKIWDLTNNQPSCLVSRNPSAGFVYSVSFSGENPFMLTIGGSSGTLKLWDTFSSAALSGRHRN